MYVDIQVDKIKLFPKSKSHIMNLIRSLFSSRSGKIAAFVAAPLLLAGSVCAAVPFGAINPSLFAAFGQHSTLTIVAKADGTFDVDEIPNYWFGPTAMGGALKKALKLHYGFDAKPDDVKVVVKQDPGATDAAVRTAIDSARTQGFVRFAFADPGLANRVAGAQVVQAGF